MGRAKKAIKKAVSIGKTVASMLPLSRPVSAVASLTSSKKKPSKRKQTVASVKKKIALLKAKKELSRIRGY